MFRALLVMLTVLLGVVGASSCATATVRDDADIVLPSHDAPLLDRRAAYHRLRTLNDAAAIPGDSSRLLDVVPSGSLTAIEATAADDARRTGTAYVVAGASTVAASWTAGMVGVISSVALVAGGTPDGYALGVGVGVGAAGVALAGSAVGTALLVPGVLSWAEAVDHDVAAYSTYDADLRARLRLNTGAVLAASLAASR